MYINNLNKTLQEKISHKWKYVYWWFVAHVRVCVYLRMPIAIWYHQRSYIVKSKSPLGYSTLVRGSQKMSQFMTATNKSFISYITHVNNSACEHTAPSRSFHAWVSKNISKRLVQSFALKFFANVHTHSKHDQLSCRQEHRTGIWTEIYITTTLLSFKAETKTRIHTHARAHRDIYRETESALAEY